MTRQRPDFELKATQERIDEIYEGFSLRLKGVLEERGFTDCSLVSIARYLGLHEEKLKGLLTNTRDLPLSIILMIAEKLDVTLDYLLFGVCTKKEEKPSVPAVSEPSVYDAMFADRSKMTDMLFNTILPKLDDAEKQAVITHIRLLGRK